MISKLQALLLDRSGATAVEYGLFCALIALAITASLGVVAGPATSMWSGVAAKFAAATDK